jgi:hypothetical protein
MSLPAYFLLPQLSFADNLGVYLGAAPYGPESLPSYEQWLGREVSWMLDFAARKKAYRIIIHICS